MYLLAVKLQKKHYLCSPMAGIYIHIPFCKSRCKYCDFFSTTQLARQEEYVEALLCELDDRRHTLTEEVRTIYMGGGTPSTLPVGALSRIVQRCVALCGMEWGSRVEITLEVNPGDVTEANVRAWRAMGINRLSMGVQSFDDTLLQLIGRRHTAQQAREAVAVAQAAGFDNISIDLMYALPTETMPQWQNDIAEALKLGVQHISSYGLIYEEGTVLMTLLEHGVVDAVDEDVEMQMYDYLVETLTRNGYVHYEVSNFALLGRESKHNSSYWNDTPYLGLGAGAHSYDGEKRQWNVSDLDMYIQQARAHALLPEIEWLTEEQRHTERVMLGLRTNRGVAMAAVDMNRARGYVQRGLLRQEGERLVATKEGFHILNRIIEDLL